MSAHIYIYIYIIIFHSHYFYRIGFYIYLFLSYNVFFSNQRWQEHIDATHQASAHPQWTT